MKGYLLLFIVSLACLVVSCSSATEASKFPEILGNYPLCEPSAVIKIACPDRDGDCLLVGDNEIKDSLFFYPLDSGKLKANQQQELSLEGVEISDIEAIASLDKNQVLIVGSHSRNSKCETKKSRRRWLAGIVSDDSFQPINKIVQTPKINSQLLFEDIDREDNQIVRAVAKAIDNAERAANSAEGNREACSTTNHFNIEGAVAINHNSSESDIWMGLRSPLVSLEDKNLAILLHLKTISSYQFDRVTLLDLGGRGIRELTLWQNYLWGIAGGPEDDLDNFLLWQLPIKLLKSDTIVAPKIVRSLPISSEGLVFVDSTNAYILIDGDIGDSNSSCSAPGTSLRLKVHRD